MRGKRGNLYGYGNWYGINVSVEEKWSKIGGATAASYSIPATVTADAGTYTVVVSGTCTQA
jgi:hypothetical protein